METNLELFYIPATYMNVIYNFKWIFAQKYECHGYQSTSKQNNRGPNVHVSMCSNEL